MQLNTLNRVIALFLIGGFVVVMAAVALKDQIRALLTDPLAKEWGAPAGVFLAVALLSITALAGTIVDAIGNLTIRRPIKWVAKHRTRARAFFCAEEFDEHELWRQAFRDALEKVPRHQGIAQNDMIKAASAAVFFRTAEKEHTEWLIQHHSMYHLSANFVIILVACAVWSFLSGAPILGVGSIVGAYLLITFALDNYLYTYQICFRNAYLTLNDMHATLTAPNAEAAPKIPVIATPVPHDISVSDP